MNSMILINYNPSSLYGRNEILNLLVISSILQKSSIEHNIIEIDSNLKMPETKHLKTIIITSRENSVIKYCENLRKNSKNKIFILFFHEYWNYFAYNSNGIFDAIIMNNNFGAIEDLFVKKLPVEMINGIILFKKNWVIKNNESNLYNIENLKTLPYYNYPNLGIYKETAFSDKQNPDGYKTALMFLTRGCVGNCRFCINPSFYQNKIHKRALNSFIDDIIFFNKKGINHFSFEDDIFTFSAENLKDIYKEFEKNKINIKYRAHSRLDQIDEEKAWLLKKTGCFRLDIGIESGSLKILDYINKNIDLSELSEKIDILISNSIKPYILFICGFPEETIKDLENTQILINKLKKKKINYGISFFRNIPGTLISEEIGYDKSDFSNHKFSIIDKNYSKIPDKELFDFYFKNTGIKPQKYQTDCYFLEDKININIKDYSKGEFEPIQLNYWDEIEEIAHLVGRFNGYIEYNFKSVEKTSNILIEFYCCTQNENRGQLEVILNDYSIKKSIPCKSEYGEKISVVFKNIKLQNNNLLKFNTIDNNGLTLFNKNILMINKNL